MTAPLSELLLDAEALLRQVETALREFLPTKSLGSNQGGQSR